ncbi:hypothetical protein B0H17DRAFT_1141183 [Mycena rosella]|uniref:Uncharacterized protein n=1 Tax=Mycena rosella TaxID=1033263 RepID=A0AAD7G9A4_MYCRO|nr:hypothetical protein B0H17DRAFT_1141183 [Mycena rosella]
MRPQAFVYHAHHNFHSWRGGPRRAIWFILGAATATAWASRNECHRQTNERYFGHCFRPPIAPMQPRAPDGTPEWRPRNIPAAVNNIPPAAAIPPPAPLPWGYPESHRDRQWEEEKRKLQAIGQQAEDVMAKLSEATLDSVMTTMEALKVKLAEHRAQREQAQRQLEEELEEQRKNPHRFV